MTQHNPYKIFIRKLLFSKAFLFLITLALIGLFISVGQESYRKYQLAKEISQLKSEIENLEGRNQQLADLMEYFKEESYLEKESRLKLNLKKPGEKVVILSQAEPADTLEENSGLSQGEDLSKLGNSETSAKEANWWKWWEYFFASD